jgi:dienelactone hydrolase
MRRRLHPAHALLAAVLASALLAGCASVPTASGHERSVAPRAGQHIVVVVNTAGPAAEPANLDYITDRIASRGMGMLTLPETLDSESIKSSVSETVRLLQEDPQTAGHPVVLLAVGHGAAMVWALLADPPPGLVAAVTINVPGTPGLDFTDGLAVATLSLNLDSDTLATESHHEVHEAMSAAGTLHQVIVYGGVEANALDQSSPRWDAATAEDAALRTADWLQNRDGFTNQNMENPNPHH